MSLDTRDLTDLRSQKEESAKLLDLRYRSPEEILDHPTCSIAMKNYIQHCCMVAHEAMTALGIPEEAMASRRKDLKPPSVSSARPGKFDKGCCAAKDVKKNLSIMNIHLNII